MKAPPSTKGIVSDKKLFSRAIKDKKSKGNEKGVLEAIDKDYDKELATLKDLLVEKMMKFMGGLTCNGIFNKYKEEMVKKGAKFTAKVLQGIDYVTEMKPARQILSDMVEEALDVFDRFGADDGS